MMNSFRSAVGVAAVLLSACGRPATTPVEPSVASADAPPTGPSTPSRLSPDEVVAIVASRYPERMAGDVSYEQRVANMAFLRDRILEVGICGGLNLAWNRKSNGGRSIDAIDWRHGESDINDVVDLAFAYDDTDRPLQLHWRVTEGPAGWDPYPDPVCGA